MGVLGAFGKCLGGSLTFIKKLFIDKVYRLRFLWLCTSVRSASLVPFERL
jgi:hypothetical protein